MYKITHYTGHLINGTRPVFFIQQINFHGIKEHVFYEWPRRDVLEINATHGTVAVWKVKRKEVNHA